LYQSEEILKNLEIRFVNQNKDRYSEIFNAISSEDYKLAHRLVHSLKGNAGQIGRTQLEKIAGIIETQLDELDLPISSEALEQLNNELSKIIVELTHLLDDNYKKIKLLNDNQAIELLNTIEEMLYNKNPKVLKLLDDVRGLHNDENDIVGKLIHEIEDYNFSSALIIASDIKKELCQS